METKSWIVVTIFLFTITYIDAQCKMRTDSMCVDSMRGKGNQCKSACKDSLREKDTLSNTMCKMKMEASLKDSVVTKDSVVASGANEMKMSLLPEHYLFTQRWLWGENGKNRKNGKYPLTLEGREHEMDIRANLNKWHRIAGYTALASMIGAGISGQKLADGNEGARTYHNLFTGLTNVSYFGSLGLALFSPPPMRDREGGLTSVNAHRYLAILHVTSMLATDILSGLLPNNPDLIPYHKAAAITAFSSLFVATVVINL